MSADELTPAETLRAAAKVLRERAEAATPGPWGFTDSEAAASLVNLPDDGMVVMYGGDTPVALCADEFYENEPGEPAPVNDAQYIATMHPGMGLALADWLDLTARRFDEGLGYPGDYEKPLTVARLILGAS